jgi:Tol biopolymer transport system component
VGLAIAALLVIATAASAAPRASAPLIAFSGARFADGYTIYTVRPDGSRRRSLGAGFSQPEGVRIAFSPDGRRIAFPNDYELVIANADGSRRREVQNTGVNGGAAVSWAPDGRTIVVSSEKSLGLVDVETGKVHGVQAYGDSPVFSPKGDLIAFIDEAGLSVVDADGTHLRHLASAPPRDEFDVPPPSWSPDGREIAYERFGDVLVYNLAAGKPRNLTRSPQRQEVEPAWSPNGRWIAFVRGGPTSAGDLRTGVSIVHPDGTGLRSLTDEQFVEHAPVWSPDTRSLAFLGGAREGQVAEPPNSAYTVPIKGGKARRIARQVCGHPEHLVSLTWGAGQLAFASTTFYNDSQVYVGRTDATGIRGVATSCAYETDPAWSPDGREIAYDRSVKGYSNYELFVMRADGAHKRRLAKGLGPDWSPDGKSIVYATEGKKGQIYVIPNAGGKPRRLTEAGANGTPDWSGAAGRIAFTSNRDGRLEVYTMRPDGGDERRITRLGGFGAAWSPDGKRLAFVLGPNIWTIDPDGSNPLRVTNYDGCTNTYEPAWSPDGKTIAFGFYSDDYEAGGIAFVPAAGGEVNWMPYNPLVGAAGGDNGDAPTYSSPDWYPRVTAAASDRRPARATAARGCINTG